MRYNTSISIEVLKVEENTKMRILTVNVGSSSLKMAVFNEDDHNNAVGKFEIKNIGTSSPKVYWKNTDGPVASASQDVKDHSSAVKLGITWIGQVYGDDPFAAICFRIVHGGPNHTKHEFINKKVFDSLKAFSLYDTEHLPETLKAIALFAGKYKNAKYVACYDTAFFNDLPDNAKRLPLPRALDFLGVRRYGFHGLSYTYLQACLDEKKSANKKSKKVIMAHLGSGSSIVAVKNGKPIDTSMSFSPNSGLFMSTRSGDMDPGLLMYLNRAGGLSLPLINGILNKESGLKGISSLSSDMYTLIQRSDTNKHAKQAVEMYCNAVVKAIGGYIGLMDGVDTIVFSGGIGEESKYLRKKICDKFSHIGVKIDTKANNKNKELISKRSSTVKLYRFATDESQVMANIARNLLGLHKKVR